MNTSPLFFVGIAGLTLVLLVAMAGFRLLRRGFARFHLSPPLQCLALIPAGVALCYAAWELRTALGSLALTGSGFAGVIAAGSSEILGHLSAGLIATLLLTILVLVVVAAGTSRTPDPARRVHPPLASFVGTLIAIASLAALSAAVLFAAVKSVGLVDLALRMPSFLIVLACVFTTALPLVVVLGVLQAPRERPSGVALTIALALPVLTVGVTALLLTVSLYASRCLRAAALTGNADACPLTADESMPKPFSQADRATGDVDAFPPIPPPPPPPPPRRARGVPETSSEGGLDSGVEGGIAGGVEEGVRSGAIGRRREDRSETTPEAIQPVRVGGAIKEPKKLKNVPPVFPEIARQARVQGVVILEVKIDPKGQVTDIKVLRGIPLLDQAAIDAVRQWIYTPTLLNGVPVPIIMTVTVNFRLS